MVNPVIVTLNGKKDSTCNLAASASSLDSPIKWVIWGSTIPIHVSGNWVFNCVRKFPINSFWDTINIISHFPIFWSKGVKLYLINRHLLHHHLRLHPAVKSSAGDNPVPG